MSEPVHTEVVHAVVWSAARSHACRGPSCHLVVLAGAAGYQDDVRMRDVGQGGLGGQRQAALLVADQAQGPASAAKTTSAPGRR